MKISVTTLYEVHSTSEFRKQLKKVAKQGKDISLNWSESLRNWQIMRS